MIKVLIIDDEASGRNVLQLLIQKHLPEYEVVGSAENIEEAYRLIIDTQPNILLLDIEMPDGNGFELLSKFKTINFAVIFVTAHEEYALKALKMSAADYLLKPASKSDLESALIKAAEALRLKNNLKTNLQLPLHNIFTDEKVLVLNKYSGEKMPIKEIIYIEADSNYSIIHGINKRITSSKTLKELEEILCFDLQGFQRVHKSYIINFTYLTRVLKEDSQNYVLLTNGKRIEVSKRRWTDLKKLIPFYKK